MPRRFQENRTVKQLLDYCPQNGIRGYSGLRKADLIDHMSSDRSCSSSSYNYEVTLKNKTVKQLHDYCRVTGIQGYLNRKKDDLVDFITSEEGYPNDYRTVLENKTVDQLHEYCRQWSIRGYSNKRKDELIGHIISEVNGPDYCNNYGINMPPKRKQSAEAKNKDNAKRRREEETNQSEEQRSQERTQAADVPVSNRSEEARQIPAAASSSFSNRNHGDGIGETPKSEFPNAWEGGFGKNQVDYHILLALNHVALIPNVEEFECPVCFLDVEVGEGATLHECSHSFCKECLIGAIQFSENATVKCPFRNDEYSCECILQEREIKSLVTPEEYERHLQRSVKLAESQAQNSFHCKTPDCLGWCITEDDSNTFLCPVCKHINCLTCAAIHEGKNCKEYQELLTFMCDSNEEARRTKAYLQSKLDNGKAMRCPTCQVILMKNTGCDWLKCSMCHTEVCWATKGPRWGPRGHGDTSGGCRCLVRGKRCHPTCKDCH